MDHNSSINGFSINKFSKQLYLNSKYANYTVDTSRNSSCSFVLNEPINIPKGMNAYCSVVSAEIPNTIFSVDQFTSIPIIITKAGGATAAISSTAGNVITCTSTASMVIGQPIIFQGAFGTITPLTVFYILTIPSSTTFTISSSFGGATYAVGAQASTSINTLFGTSISTTCTATDANGNFTLASLANLSVGSPMFCTSTTGISLNTTLTYIIASINSSNSTITLKYGASGANVSTTVASGTATLYFAPTITQTYNITGSQSTNGTASNLFLTAGNYSSSIYNTTNPTNLAAQFSKALTFTQDGSADTITLVCYYGVPQTKFFLGFYPTKGVYSISINAPVLGFISSNNQPQIFTQLTTATPTITNITFNATNQTYQNLTIANNIPRFFPPYIVIGTNLHANNQAVGETKISTLAKVIVDVPYNAFIFFRNAYAYSNWISNRELFTIELYLYDENGALINMQGAPWSITLQIDYD